MFWWKSWFCLVWVSPRLIILLFKWPIPSDNFSNRYLCSLIKTTLNQLLKKYSFLVSFSITTLAIKSPKFCDSIRHFDLLLLTCGFCDVLFYFYGGEIVACCAYPWHPLRTDLTILTSLANLTAYLHGLVTDLWGREGRIILKELFWGDP